MVTTVMDMRGARHDGGDTRRFAKFDACITPADQRLVGTLMLRAPVQLDDPRRRLLF